LTDAQLPSPLLATTVHYRGQRAALATMHGKENVIAPALRERIGLIVETPVSIDTDTLGTFTGEVPRVGTMREVAIAKARLGIAASGLRIGIGSEGTYGPHPHIPFVPGGMELMVLVDDELGIVVAEHLIDDAPVYDHEVVTDAGELPEFLQRTGFPAQALIAMPYEPVADNYPIHKGLGEKSALSAAITDCAPHSRDGRVIVQTDMRAHMNPSRMKTVGRLARKLGERIATACPACRLPGFGQTGVEGGLPCRWCGAKSVMYRHEIYGCVACDHREWRQRADGLTHADPGRCPECNP
jgi:hypothetical protein